jgi:hypothetical protein
VTVNIFVDCIARAAKASLLRGLKDMIFSISTGTQVSHSIGHERV